VQSESTYCRVVKISHSFSFSTHSCSKCRVFEVTQRFPCSQPPALSDSSCRNSIKARLRCTHNVASTTPCSLGLPTESNYDGVSKKCTRCNVSTRQLHSLPNFFAPRSLNPLGLIKRGVFENRRDDRCVGQMSRSYDCLIQTSVKLALSIKKSNCGSFDWSSFTSKNVINKKFYGNKFHVNTLIKRK